MNQRDYTSAARRVSTAGDESARMQRVTDVLWEEFHSAGVSWVGFYTHPGGDELVLGARRDKPACSPIGLHGACGRAFLSRRALVVADVRALGPNYIACDPRDQSEVVVPLLRPDGTCWGVLDVDSYDLAAYDEADVHGLQAVLLAAGLTAPPSAAAPVRVG